MRPLSIALRFRPRLEALEGRCLPTVTTSFNSVTGALTLTGDGGDNHVTVTESVTHGFYSVAATDGLSGIPSFVPVKSIALDLLGQGSAAGDTADFIGNASANSFLSGALSVTAAGGLKVGFQSNFNVSGAVSVTKTTNVGGLTVKTGGTSFGGFPQANVSLGATTITNNGTGGTTVNLQGVSANDVAVRGALSVTMGSGSNAFLLINATVAGGLTQSGGDTSATIIIQKVNVGNFVSLNGTATGSGISATVAQATIGTFFSVASGNGADIVSVDSTSVLGLGLLPQQQTFGVDLKGGTNTSNIGTGGADAANVVNGSLFHFGAGTEHFNLQNYAINSFVTVNGQAGNSGVTSTISNCKVSNFLSFAAAGNTNDNVTVSNLTIGQNFALNLGGGSNTTTITNSSYLGNYSEIDTGVDSITFTGTSGFGDVTLSANQLIIAGGTFQNDQIAGNATFTGANSAGDTVFLGAAVGVAPAATNALSVGKALTINVGVNPGTRDRVQLDNVTVGTDLVVSLTAQFSLDPALVQITNTAVGRNLAVNGGGSTFPVTVDLGTIGATANTGALVVAGTLSVTTGSGSDAVSLLDVTVGDTTDITTGVRFDTVSLEGTAGNAGPSQFFGAVTVSTGDDNDTITVGTDAANPAKFLAAVTFDGGAGTDTLTETAPQYLGGPPTKVSIP
jgi:hypothetical protein